ncbi:MAG: putative sulfate exporter family transporter [Gemmatimonadaceae bacterium]|nr:putative sulfate exporter family transporter [Gemmatimonadaceae bacterium]
MTHAAPAGRHPVAHLAPGLALVLGVGAAALGGAALEVRWFGQPVIEALVLAILLGMGVRSSARLPESVTPGVDLAAKEVLEVAIVLLGASVDLPLLLRAGPALAIGIVLLVVLGLAIGYGLGRLMGLPHPLAVLVAAGNAICGNSAIAAVAPVIGADREHVASAIAFTAILGVLVVLGLPHLMGPLGLSEYQYGVLAGLTVYAVPQVLAAAFPVGTLAGQVGTLVKLVRVLMLGPVVLFFTVTHRAPSPHADAHVMGARSGRRAFTLARALPWFIVGFLVLAALRSAGAITPALGGQLKTLSGWLTILAMAALGLGVDLRALRKVGAPVVVTVSGSLLALVAMGVGLIRVLGIR